MNNVNREYQKQVASRMRGEKHPRWVNNRSILAEKGRLRGRQEWKEWRKYIFVRDKYVCQECGCIGGRLEPHHILPLRIDIKKVYDVNNGITLCRPCHQKTIMREELFIDKYSRIVLTKL